MCVCVCACVCVCLCACVCVYLLCTWKQRVAPFISARGRRGCRGAPSSEALPCTLGKTYLRRSAPGPRRGQLAGPSSSFSPSSHFVLCDSVVSRNEGRTRTLTDHLILFSYVIPLVWHAWHKAFISSSSSSSPPTS